MKRILKTGNLFHEIDILKLDRYFSYFLPIGEVNGDGGRFTRLILGGGGGGGAGNGGVSVDDPLGKGGGNWGTCGGDGIPESSGVSGDPLGGEISAKSPSLTGDILSCAITSSSTTCCSITSDLTNKYGFLSTKLIMLYTFKILQKIVKSNIFL